MPDSTFRAPQDEDYKYLAERWGSIRQLVMEESGYELNQSLADLTHLQEVLDDDVIDQTQFAMESLGVALGRVMASNIEGMDWWHVTDEYGQDVCLRYKQSTFTLHPISMITKRAARGEAIHLRQLYDAIADFVAKKVEEGSFQ